MIHHHLSLSHALHMLSKNSFANCEWDYWDGSCLLPWSQSSRFGLSFRSLLLLHRHCPSAHRHRLLRNCSSLRIVRFPHLSEMGTFVAFEPSPFRADLCFHLALNWSTVWCSWHLTKWDLPHCPHIIGDRTRGSVFCGCTGRSNRPLQVCWYQFPFFNPSLLIMN